MWPVGGPVKRVCRDSERPVVVGGVYAKSGLNVLRGAVSAKGAQTGRHSRTPVRGVIAAGLAAVLLLPGCAPVYRCVPGSEFLTCKGNP